MRHLLDWVVIIVIMAIIIFIMLYIMLPLIPMFITGGVFN